jgi:hypothetical protein
MLSTIKSFLFVSLKFYLKTKITENKLRIMFCRLCELDYSEPMNFGWFEMMAYGNSVSVECFDGYKFTMNEFQNGICVSIPVKDNWMHVYETKNLMVDLEWFNRLKLIYETLFINKVFETRQKQNLERSKIGVMT